MKKVTLKKLSELEIKINQKIFSELLENFFYLKEKMNNISKISIINKSLNKNTYINNLIKRSTSSTFTIENLTINQEDISFLSIDNEKNNKYYLDFKEANLNFNLSNKYKYFDGYSKEDLIKLHYELYIDKNKNPGKLKSKNNYVGIKIINTFGEEEIKKTIEFISHKEIEFKLDDLFIFLNNNSDYHFFIKSALLQAYIIGIHPFRDGNGRIARFITNKYLEKEMGFNFMIDEIITQFLDQYILKLDNLFLNNNYSEFINFFLELIIYQIKRNLNLIDEISSKINQLNNLLEKFPINKRYNSEIINFLINEYFITFKRVNFYLKSLNLERRTIIRILDILENKKIIKFNKKIGREKVYISKYYFK